LRCWASAILAIARQLSPALSRVRLPRHAIGAETARSLLDALRRGKPAVPVSLPWALAVRGSTAPAGATDPA
jgi:DNA-binding LacI/PurR family transcriptional regulator